MTVIIDGVDVAPAGVVKRSLNSGSLGSARGHTIHAPERLV